MKVALSGKGGTGKTSIAGTLARSLARRGHRVLAIDCDSNPNLAISLGLDAAVADALEPLPRNAFVDDVTVHQLLTAFAAIPNDPEVFRADVEGVSPLDLAPGSPGVLAVERLAKRVLAAH